MYGKNPRRGMETRDDDLIQVSEIFYTIQGEGPFVGRPAVFVRLTGCNLGCTFCDTIWDDDGDNYIEVQAIVDQVNEHIPLYSNPLVVITGGEPTRQQNVQKLVEALRLHNDIQVQIETNGMFDISHLVNLGASIVCSPKTRYVHPSIALQCQHFKYVVKDGSCHTDGLPGFFTQGKEDKHRPWPDAPTFDGKTIYIQPMDEGNEEKDARNTQYAINICKEHGYTLCLQTHKIVGLP